MTAERTGLFGLLRMPAQISFGRGALLDLPRAAAAFGERILLCTDPVLAPLPTVVDAVGRLRAAGLSVEVYDGVEPDLPSSSLEATVADLRARGISPDAVIGLGGGSCIDAAKIVALLLARGGGLADYRQEGSIRGPGVPLIAAPTTAGTGSEVSPVAVFLDEGAGAKAGIASPHLIPARAVCDPQATVSCPSTTTAHAGVDALAHAVEAATSRSHVDFWAGDSVFRGANEFSRVFALEAAAQLAASLERAVRDGSDVEARERAMFGSVCAGIAFSQAGTAGAHALQYPIGASTGTSHGLGVGLLLPYVLEYVRPHAEQPLAQLATAFGRGDDRPGAAAAIDEIARLNEALGIPRTLAEIGVAEADLPGLAARASEQQRLLRNSPRRLDAAALTDILDAAWSGERDRLAEAV